MTLTTALYLTDIIDTSKIVLVSLIVTFITVYLTLGLLCILGVDPDEIPKSIISFMKKWWLIIPMTLAIIPIPSKPTMYMMLGATYLEQSALPSKVAQALELKLDGYIDELRGEKKK
jgi:hypothetical protein